MLKMEARLSELIKNASAIKLETALYKLFSNHFLDSGKMVDRTEYVIKLSNQKYRIIAYLEKVEEY